MTRKEAATAFLTMCAGGQAPEAYDRFVVPSGFKHHNVHFKGDAATLRDAMQDAAKRWPKTTLLVKHVLEDGDTVAVHSNVIMDPGTKGVSVVHILRFQGDRVAELWDVAMPVPEQSPNEHGAF